jgi:hypothetical protein
MSHPIPGRTGSDTSPQYGGQVTNTTQYDEGQQKQQGHGQGGIGGVGHHKSHQEGKFHCLTGIFEILNHLSLFT